MNKNEFEAMMKRYGENQSILAEALGISRTSLNRRINERGGAVFTQPEIAAIKKRYKLSDDDVGRIFFDSYES